MATKYAIVCFCFKGESPYVQSFHMSERAAEREAKAEVEDETSRVVRHEIWKLKVVSERSGRRKDVVIYPPETGPKPRYAVVSGHMMPSGFVRSVCSSERSAKKIAKVLRESESPAVKIGIWEFRVLKRLGVRRRGRPSAKTRSGS